jgi:hypothetical protein
MPRFSDDDVLDFLVTEAVVMNGLEAEAEAQKKAADTAEREHFRDNHKEWAAANFPQGG